MVFGGFIIFRPHFCAVWFGTCPGAFINVHPVLLTFKDFGMKIHLLITTGFYYKPSQQDVFFILFYIMRSFKIFVKISNADGLQSCSQSLQCANR